MCYSHFIHDYDFSSAGSNPTLYLEQKKIDIDLKFQLEKDKRNIMKKYSQYVTKVRKLLAAKEVPIKKVHQSLLTLPTYSSCGKIGPQCLPEEVIAKLNLAETIDEIINILCTDWASYINYDIFELLLDECCPDVSREDLDYRSQLRSYIDMHNVAEYVAINPELEKFTNESSILTVKLDLQHETKISKVVDTKYCISHMLDIAPSALRIIGIREGCVELIIEIPAHAANTLFHHNATFSQQQQQQLKNLSIMWLKCNGKKFHFREDCLPVSSSY